MRSSRFFYVVGWLILSIGGVATVACAGEPIPQEAPDAGVVTQLEWLLSWVGEAPPVAPLDSRYPAPDGFVRVELDPDGFGAWLRSFPVRLDRKTVLSYRGSPIAAPAAAVFALDLGRGDLQQCADTIIRLHAEYLWFSGRAGEAAYHFTSGDLSTWLSWARGERFVVDGNRVRRVAGSARESDYRTFRGWLQHLFVYAGTLSMKFDSRPVEVVQAGDFFVLAGSPGHTVIVLDVAVDDEGRRVALVGQGYTPAQDFHLLGDPRSEVLQGVWFRLPDDDGDVLRVPWWGPFPRSSARRFIEGARP